MFKKLVEKVRSSNSFNAMKMGGENVKVIVRCRPMNRKELDMKCKVSNLVLTFGCMQCALHVDTHRTQVATKTMFNFFLSPHIE